jgi:ABC-2 type transport system ATP-binding protein
MKLIKPGGSDAGPGSPDTSFSDLQKELEQVGGIVQVHRDGNHFLVESDREVGPVISRKVLDAGFELNHLNRKVYGLDEIYYRYFQEGINDHEQQASKTEE